MSAVKKGAASVSRLFRLVDATTGKALAGVDVTTLKLQVARPGEAAGTATSLTLLAALTTAFTAYGARQVDATNSTGVYRVDIPDGAWLPGVNEVVITLTGASIEATSRQFDLTNPQSIEDVVTTGVTPTVSTFRGSSALSSADSAYTNALIVFNSGALLGQTHKVAGYTGATRAFTFSTGFTVAPTLGDRFEIIGRIE